MILQIGLGKDPTEEGWLYVDRLQKVEHSTVEFKSVNEFYDWNQNKVPYDRILVQEVEQAWPEYSKRLDIGTSDEKGNPKFKVLVVAAWVTGHNSVEEEFHLLTSNRVYLLNDNGKTITSLR
jgi:hypothetical protein